MNWVDLLILFLLLLFTLEGLKRGFIAETLEFLSFLLAFFLSLRFYNDSSNLYENFLKIPHSVASVLGFISIWFLTELVFIILIRIFAAKIKLPTRLMKTLAPFAIVPALLRGLVFSAILLVMVGTFPIQPTIKLAVQDSLLGSFILVRAQQLEQPLKQIFGGLTQETLTFLTIKPKSDESINLGFQTTNFSASPVLEAEMIDLVNKERVSHGFKELVYDSKLRDVGRGHSGDMFRRGYFSHFSPEGDSVAERAQSVGIDYLVIGENLAYAPNLPQAHNGLMNSLGHRANILSPDYSKIGIGIMDGGVYGLMVTQVFTN